MQIENSFTVGAPPDTVFAFLLDVNRIVGCVPGAELSEVVDPDTFRGRVRIKVGPVTVAYNGTAHITERDQQARRATLQAEGRETTGSGSARATTTMSVAQEGAGSAVHFATDFTVVGRVAQFGRGIMEEVSRKLVGQMAECIRTKLEAEGAAAPAPAAAEQPSSNGAAKDEGSSRTRSASPRRPRASAKPAAEPSIAVTGAPAATEAVPSPAESSPAPAEPLSTAAPAVAASGAAPISGGPATAASTTTPPGRVQLATEPAEAAVPLDALALARSIAADRIKAVGPGRLAGIAVALFAVFAFGRWLRGRAKD